MFFFVNGSIQNTTAIHILFKVYLQVYNKPINVVPNIQYKFKYQP